MSPLPIFRTGLPYPVVVTNFSASKFSKKELVATKDVFSRVFFLPAFSTFYPGKIILSRVCWSQIDDLLLRVGYPVTLDMLPYHLGVSYVYDVSTKKPTYATSHGCFIARKRDKLRSKLLYFRLPSGAFKYFTDKTYAYLGGLTNYSKEEFFFGSWGVKWKLRKTIHVRGVAKNPVDHPNGGRAKAKQPERSPWGWVAKLQR